MASNPKTNPHSIPSLAALRKTRTAGTVMKSIIAQDELVAKTHASFVIIGMCRRYSIAQLIASDSKAYAAFAKDPLVVNLKRPLRGVKDTFRAVCYATIPDPRLASKRFKRLEHLWDADKPVEEVEKLLKRYGWEKPIPGVTAPRPRPRDDAEDDDGERDRRAAQKIAFQSRTRQSCIEEEPVAGSPEGPTAVIYNAPPHYPAGVGAQVTIGGTVLAVDDGKITIAVSAFRKTSEANH